MYLFNNKLYLFIYLIKKLILILLVCQKQNKKYKDLETILYLVQDLVYCSKRFNDSLYLYNIIHFVYKPGPPTEKDVMKTIKG